MGIDDSLCSADVIATKAVLGAWLGTATVQLCHNLTSVLAGPLQTVFEYRLFRVL